MDQGTEAQVLSMNGYGKLAIPALITLVMIGIGIWLPRHHGGQAQSAGTLTISITDTPDPVSVGDIVTYMITVQNTGTTEETGVLVQDSLTGRGTIQSATTSQGSCDPPTGTPAAATLTCTLGTLGPGAKASITVKKLATGPVGGTTELLVGRSDAAASPADGSGPAVPYAAVAGGAAVAAIAIAAGGWYARGRWRRRQA